MARTGSMALLLLALAGAAVALFWPQIEQQLAAQGVGCPWPFHALAKLGAATSGVESPAAGSETAGAPFGGGDSGAEVAGAAADAFPPLKPYTLEELSKYDGSDESLPILLAVAGKVLDVSSGAKFYAPGKTYHQFAGSACTRALALSSLKKEDINDDIADFNEKQINSLEETKEFYFDKYPAVGVLV